MAASGGELFIRNEALRILKLFQSDISYQCYQFILNRQVIPPQNPSQRHLLPPVLIRPSVFCIFCSLMDTACGIVTSQVQPQRYERPKCLLHRPIWGNLMVHKELLSRSFTLFYRFAGEHNAAVCLPPPISIHEMHKCPQKWSPFNKTARKTESWSIQIKA